MPRHLLSTTLIPLAGAVLLGVLGGLGDWSASALLAGMALVAVVWLTLLVRADRAHDKQARDLTRGDR